MMPLSPLTALSPLDGRYRDKVSRLSDYFSEFGLIRYRILVEIEWLKALCAANLDGIPSLSATTVKQLDAVVRDFLVTDADAVKQIEARTNHDVKAIEYWLKERLSDNPEIGRVTRNLLRFRVPDLTRVRETIGYRPRRGLEDIVREVIAWKTCSPADRFCHIS